MGRGRGGAAVCRRRAAVCRRRAAQVGTGAALADVGNEMMMITYEGDLAEDE